MKVLVVCSTSFYDRVEDVKNGLEKNGHVVYLPNCYDAPQTESKYRGTKEHSAFKAKMFRQSEQTISKMDAVLVLNYDKNGYKKIRDTTHRSE